MNRNIQQIYKDIKTIKIQGATNVALAVGKALKRLARDLKVDSRREFVKQISQSGKYLLSARATEPMADNVVEFVFFQIIMKINK